MTVSTPLTAPACPPETGAVEEVEALGLGRRVELARDVGRGGGVVDEDGALALGLEGAALGRRHRAQIVVVADAAEHEVGVLRRFGRRRGGLAAELLGPRLGLGAVAVVDVRSWPPFLRMCPAIG